MWITVLEPAPEPSTGCVAQETTLSTEIYSPSVAISLIMDIVDTARTVAGDSLRSVAEYRGKEYAIYFVREDVDRKNLDVDTIHQNLVLDGIGREFLEELFQAGELRCTSHQFEKALMLHFAFPENSGLFVSVDADGTVAIHELVDVCQAWREKGREGTAFE